MLSLKHLRGIGSTPREIKSSVYIYRCFSGLQPLFSKEDIISFSVIHVGCPSHFSNCISKRTAYFSVFFISNALSAANVA